MKHQRGEDHMKMRLKRILSILCILALFTGCLALAAFADEEKVTRVIVVQWADEDNYEGKRPESVTMTIGDGESSVVLNEDNGWTGAAEAADSNWAIEDLSGLGYTASTSGTDVKVVTYTLPPVEKTFLNASVVWDDGNNAAGLRPDSVRVNLLADGKLFRAPETAKESNEWTVSWKNLPRTREKSTEQIVYSIEQADLSDAYETKVEGAVITNKLKTGKLTLQASLSGVPEGADVSSLRLTVSGPNPGMPVTLTYAQLTGGTYDFGDVVPGAYVLQENNADSLVEGYVMDPAGSKVGDAVYVKAGESKTLSFSYAWKEPEEEEENADPMAEVNGLTFEIIGPDSRLPITVTYADFTNGRYELNDLVPGEYAVIERNPEGLVRAYSLTSDSVTGMALTVGKDGATAALLNRYVPAPTPTPDAEVIDIPVAKIWNDNNDKDGNRPDSVTVHLYANGVLNETRVITAADGWTATFTEKPRYDENGEEIVYTVNEDPVEWYVTGIDGWFITNTYKPEVTSASVQKVWDDQNNARKIRPTSIAVTLLPTGEVFVLNEANGWSLVKNDLPTRINGEPVTYSWAEQETVGYVLTGTSVQGSATVFTNRAPEVPHVPPTEPQPKVPGNEWVIFEEYDTALGGELLINHVGDCFD